jgi:hypothetical protein
MGYAAILAFTIGAGALLLAGQVAMQATAAETCVWRGGGRPKCVPGKARCLAGERRISVRQRLGSCPQVLCCCSEPGKPMASVTPENAQ